MTIKGRPGGPPEPRDRKRPAPTIDLTATEVAGGAEDPAQPTEPAAAEAASSPAPPAPEAPEPVASETAPATAGPADMSSAEAPPAQPAGAAFEGDAEPPQSRPASARLALGFRWPLIAAGVGGVALTLIVLAAAGVFSSNDSSNNPVEPRIARLEQQVSDLAAQPPLAPVEPKAVDDLAARLGRLETVVATPRPPVTDPALANRIATLEGEIKALGERIGVLGRRNDEIASLAGEARRQADATAAAVADLRKTQTAAGSPVPRGDLDALANRIAALERTSKAIGAQLGSRAESGERSLRMLVVAGALGAAVDGGRPFVAELEAAKAVALDAKALAPLERFAQAGIPSTDTLARELSTLVPALAKAVGSSPPEGILDRLKANAEKIVRVRPIKDATGDDPAALVQRIEARAAERNLAGALAEIAKLPVPARDLTKEWVGTVEARNAAVEATRRFYAVALAALGKPSQ